MYRHLAVNLNRNMSELSQNSLDLLNFREGLSELSQNSLKLGTFQVMSLIMLKTYLVYRPSLQKYTSFSVGTASASSEENHFLRDFQFVLFPQESSYISYASLVFRFLFTL